MDGMSSVFLEDSQNGSAGFRVKSEMPWMSQDGAVGRGPLGKKLLRCQNRMKVRIILKMGCW